MVRGHRDNPDLHSDGDVSIALDHDRSLFRTCVAEIEQLFDGGNMKPHAGDMHEREDTGTAGGNCSSAKLGEVGKAGGSRIYGGGGAVGEADLGVDTLKYRLAPG